MVTDPFFATDCIEPNAEAPAGITWRVAAGLTPYPAAVSTMEAHVAAIQQGRAGELAWLVEHPALYTTGVRGSADDVRAVNGVPVYPTRRGGQVTYHGPGQRVVYLMMDLRRRGKDVRAYVRNLEAVVMETLAMFGVAGRRDAEHVGVWVDRGDGRADKIAAIGVRVSRWVSYHGLALNVAPDLTHFSAITPCGVTAPGLGVTSLADLGVDVGMEDVDAALGRAVSNVFGPVSDGD